MASKPKRKRLIHMTQRTTFTLQPSDSVRQGIPSISNDDANAAMLTSSNGSQSMWTGVRIDHKPQPGYTTESAVSIVQQSNDLVVAFTTTTGNIELYYPNHPLYGNANLTNNQGSMDWDTHYYMEIRNLQSSTKRENVAIRKIIL